MGIVGEIGITTMGRGRDGRRETEEEEVRRRLLKRAAGKAAAVVVLASLLLRVHQTPLGSHHATARTVYICTSNSNHFP